MKLRLVDLNYVATFDNYLQLNVTAKIVTKSYKRLPKLQLINKSFTTYLLNVTSELQTRWQQSGAPKGGANLHSGGMGGSVILLIFVVDH